MEDQVENSLRVGVLALRSSTTTQQVDFVEKKFSELRHQFDDQLKLLFGDEGDLKKYIEDHFGEDGKLLKAFDPATEGTPMNILKRKMDTEFEKLRQDLAVAEKEDELVDKTTLKGGKFEEELDPMLRDIAKPFGDMVQYTGEEIGELDRCKKGDFVVTVNDKHNIAIEAKDQYLSQPKIKEEMETAIENRDAEYGILVAKSINNIPDEVGWFNEYGNRLVVALTEGEESEGEESDLQNEMLQIAYKWARMKTLEGEAVEQDELDVTALKEELTGISDEIYRFRNIRSKLTNIEDASSDIRDELKEIQSGVKTSLDSLNTELDTAITG